MIQHDVACAFPGQGIQKVGMASMIWDSAAWRFFEEANAILGYDLGKLCLEGPQDVLNDTARAQVAIFVTCFALWELHRKRYQPKVFLGHSLGEITALGAAGAFSFAEGVQLVAARGKLMAHCGAKGGMVAILGLELGAVHELCAEVAPLSYCQVANENSPVQTVVSGELDALDHLTTLAKEKGAKKVLWLNVSGPFHSRLMEPAAQEFAKVVGKLELSPCHTPVLSNDGQSLMVNPQEVRARLVAQITSPVRFTGSVQRLVELGVREFVEISPESVLVPLARRSERRLQFTLVRDGGM